MMCTAGAITALMASCTTQVVAQAGILDETFGTKGIAEANVDMPGCRDALVLPDGRILLSGSTRASGFALVRFDASGHVDTGFGQGGVSVTQFEKGPKGGGGMLLMEDGRILVGAAGGMARFLPDGAADTSFGSEGGVVADGSGMILQRLRDGRIFGGGTLLNPRLDGTRDTSFGKDGLVPTLPNDYGFGNPVEQPDGKIVFTGRAYRGKPNKNALPEYALLARTLPDGTPDPSFGQGGRVVLSNPRERWTAAVSPTLQSDGKILVALFYASDYYFIVLRYNPDGTPDTTFGRGGMVSTDISRKKDRAERIVLQPDGKILVGGTTERNDMDIALVRYLPDGTLDASFGQGGKVVTDVEPTPPSEPETNKAKSKARDAASQQLFHNRVADLLLLPDGKILVAGTKFTLFRYLGDSPGIAPATAGKQGPP